MPTTYLIVGRESDTTSSITAMARNILALIVAIWFVTDLSKSTLVSLVDSIVYQYNALLLAKHLTSII
jgi:hypothetical protein